MKEQPQAQSKVRSALARRSVPLPSQAAVEIKATVEVAVEIEIEIFEVEENKCCSLEEVDDLGGPISFLSNEGK